MGLNINRLVLNGINLAMRMTPDVQKTISYVRVKGSTYDVTTGSVTNAQTVATDIAAIITPYRESETETDVVKMGLESVVLRFKDLMLQDIATVDVDDVLIENDGPIRQVVQFVIDPTRQVVRLVTKRQDSLDRGNWLHDEETDPVSGENDGAVFG